MKISAVVIAKDEEKKIGECFESLGWADEILLVDSGSKDKTVEIAKSFGVKVVKFGGGNYSKWRNKGSEESEGEWILYVDADERVTPLLRKEILSIINSKLSILNYSAYAIPRRNFILGSELKHGGWWPDYAKRLFYKPQFKSWKGDLHEEPEYEGQLGHLKNPLIHLKHDNFEDMVDKTNKWSEIEAKLMFEAQHPPMNALKFFSAGFREFWLRMVRHLAFLDGPKGVMYALYQVYSRLISYAKLWERQINHEGGNI